MISSVNVSRPVMVEIIRFRFGGVYREWAQTPPSVTMMVAHPF